MVVLAVLSFAFSLVVVVSAISLCMWWRARQRFYVSRCAHRVAVAERVLSDQGILANAMAHELKNPVTAIVCAAQTFELLLESSLDAGQRTALRHIREHGEYVLSLMGDFIDVTRGVTGQLRSQKEDMAVAGPVRAVVGMLDAIASKKKVGLEIRGCDEVPMLSVDPKHFKQILFNVAHNAVKFSPDGGKVLIAAREHSDGCGGCFVTISVKDKGPGIAPSRLSSIYDAAANFKAARSEQSGCGLGLPIVKALVDAEGGELRICGKPGEGTEVSVTFPAVGESQSFVERSTENAEKALPLAGQKVLVVEDDPELRESVSGLIRALGGVVDGVGEAVQALEAVQRSHYSTVVIDEYVGGLSADEVAQMMRAQPGAQAVRFVVTGDGANDGALEPKSSLHCTLEKPFDSKALVASLLARE